MDAVRRDGLAPGGRAERLEPVLASAFAEAQGAMRGTGLRLEVEVSWIELRLPAVYPRLSADLRRGRMGLAMRRWLRSLGVRVVVRVDLGEDGLPRVEARGVPTGLVSWWIKALRPWLLELGDGVWRGTAAWIGMRFFKRRGRSPS